MMLACHSESVSTDFHELRQDFSPTSTSGKISRIGKLYLYELGQRGFLFILYRTNVVARRGFALPDEAISCF